MPDSEFNQDSPDKDSLSRDAENPDALPDTGTADGREPSPVAGATADIETLGRYEILQQLGRGGFGTVYRAVDTVLKRSVALKIPHASPSQGADARARWEHEIRMMAQLTHPNICQVYDVAEIDGLPVISMEYIDGQTLEEFTKTGHSLSHEQAVQLVHQVASALAIAHRNGVIHRDLRPSNIMIAQTDPSGSKIVPMVMDLGLVRRGKLSSAGLTSRGAAAAAGTVVGSVIAGLPVAAVGAVVGSLMAGTPEYMSPEVATAGTKDLDARSDIYSLGVILYQLLSGRLPFERRQEASAGRSGDPASEVPTRLSEHKPDVDPELERIVMKASAPNPDDRYSTMADLEASLKDWLTDKTSGAEPPPSSPEPSDEPEMELTDNQIIQMFQAVSEHQTPGIGIIEIRRQTLEELDRAILCSLTLVAEPTRVEEPANPLIWCRQHPGQTADVQLTIADPAERGATSTISGTLVMQPSATTTDQSAANIKPLSAPAGHRSTGSKLTTLLLRGDSGHDDFDEEFDDEPELLLDSTEDDFELPEESEFELSLTALPSHVRLATGTVHTSPIPPDVFATATGEWPYLARLLPHRPESPALESRSQPKQLRLDSDSTTPQPFVSACTSDGSVTASLFDNAELQVHVSIDSSAAEVPLVAELTAVCRGGTSFRRYVLEPEPTGLSGGDSVRRCKVRTPSDAADSRVTLTIRPLMTTDTCLLTQAQRHQWLSSPPLCNLTVQGLADDTYWLSTFDFELDDVEQNVNSALLFRLLERNGGAQ